MYNVLDGFFDPSLIDWLIENKFDVGTALTIQGGDAESFFAFSTENYEGEYVHISMASGEVETLSNDFPQSMLTFILSKWIDQEINLVPRASTKSPYIEIEHDDFELEFGHVVNAYSEDFVYLLTSFKPSFGASEEGFLLVNDEKGFNSFARRESGNYEFASMIPEYKKHFITSCLTYTISNNGKHLSIEGKDDNNRFSVQLEVQSDDVMVLTTDKFDFISTQDDLHLLGDTRTECRTHGLAKLSLKIDEIEREFDDLPTDWIVSQYITGKMYIPSTTSESS